MAALFAVIRDRKHGDHDQSEHGNWATGENQSEYRGSHRAPNAQNGAPLHDLLKIYPDDVYQHGIDYYGHYGDRNNPLEQEAWAKVKAFRGNPDATTTMYRAVPKDAPDEIAPGDWVTIVRGYAVEHGEGPLRGEYKIVEKNVPVGALFTAGDSIMEWGYDPSAQAKSLKHGDHDQSEHGNWATMTPKEREQAALEHQSDLSWDKRTYTHLSPHPLTNLQENVLINWVETAGAHRNISNMFRQWGPDPSKWVDNIRASGAAPTSREEESAFAAQQMASAFATSPGLSQDVTLYRGWANAPDFEVGQEFVSEGFTSTSSDQAVAGAFGGGGTVFHMKVPAGTRAIDMGETFNPGESEVLLDANMRWRVASVETVDSVPVDRHIDNTQGMPDKETKIVTLELVPEKPVSKSVKHEAGPDHDQDDHGNWARVQRDETERAKNDPWANSMISRSDAYATLNDYTGNGAIHINRFLRNGEAAESGARSKANLEQDIDAIDALFFRAPRLTVPETVYRGISSRVGGEVFADVQPGFVFTDPGYTSTSLSSAVAQNFTGYGQQKKYVMEITLPQGSQVVEVEASNEKEILLNRGSSFRVDNVETQGDTKVIMATLLEGLESTKSLKHGDHDQSDHGNWATGGRFQTVSADKAIEASNRNSATVIIPRNPKVERALLAYTSQKYDDDDGLKPVHAVINNALREGRTFEEMLKQLDSADAAAMREFDKQFQPGEKGWKDVPSVIAQDTLLYRGMPALLDPDQAEALRAGKPIDFGFGEIKPGDVIADAGYGSTSTNYYNSEYFGMKPVILGDPDAPEQVPVIWKITAPQGTPAMSVSHNIGPDRVYDEDEVILGRNTHYRIDNVTYNAIGSVVVDATIVPTHETSKSVKHEAGPDHDQDDHGNWARGLMTPEVKGRISAAVQELDDYTPDGQDRQDRIERVMEEYVDTLSPANREAEAAEIVDKAQAEFIERRTAAITRAIPEIVKNVSDFREAGGTFEGVDADMSYTTVEERIAIEEKMDALWKEMKELEPTPGANMMQNAMQREGSEPETTELIIARDANGKLAGAMALEGNYVAYLGSSGTLPGTGSALMYEAMTLARGAGDAGLSLESVPRAARFYEEKLGLANINDEMNQEGYYGDQWGGSGTHKLSPGELNLVVDYVEEMLPRATPKSLKHADHDQSEHGNWATGASMRLEKYSKEFASAGGTIDPPFKAAGGESVTKIPGWDKLEGKYDEAAEEYDRLADDNSISDDDPALLEAKMRERGIDLTAKAMESGGLYDCIVARASDGSIAGALSYYIPGEENQLTVQMLGSTHEVPGTGTALMRQAMQVALDNNIPFQVLDPVESAQGWYESLGLGELTMTEPSEFYEAKPLYRVEPDRLAELLAKPPAKSIKHGDHDQSEHGNWASGVAKEWASDPRLRTGSEAWEKFKTLDQVPPYKIGTEHEAAEPQVALRLAKNLQQFKDAGGTIKAIPKLPNAGVSGAFTYVETEEQTQLSEWLAREAEVAKEAEQEYALRAGDAEAEEEQRRLMSISEGYGHMAVALERPSVGTFVAMQGDQVVGVLNGGFNNNEYNATMLGTSQDVPGTGSALIEAAMRAMHDRGLRQMTVEMPEEQSLGFYKALGMVPDHGTRDWVGVPSPSSVAILTGSVSRILDAVDGRTPPEIVSDYKPAKSIKHGDHDQSEHGNWAHGTALDKFVKPVRVQSYESTREKQWDEGTFKQFTSDQDLANANLTKAQAAAVLEYAQNEYAELNGLLRGHDMGVSTVSQELHAARMTVLDEAIAANSLEEDTTLYRGAGLTRQTHERLLSTLEVGGVYTDPAFGSTTTDRSIAGGFASGLIAGETYGIDYQVRWEINAPEGSAALSVTDLVPKSREAEVLLPRNSHYRVDSVRTEPMPGGAVGIGRTTVKMTLLPTESTKSIKHEAGPDHDQLDHGNWATGARASAYDPAVDKPPADNERQSFDKDSATTWRGVDTPDAQRATEMWQSGLSASEDENGNLMESHRYWNQQLRAGASIEDLGPTARTLDALINENVLREDMTLYRGVSIPIHDPLQAQAIGDAIDQVIENGSGTFESIDLPGLGTLKAGDIFADGGFLSTSKSDYTASQFAFTRSGQSDANFDANIIWNISAPAGTSALDLVGSGGRDELYVDALDRDSGEKEVILPRNTHLEITKIELGGDDNEIHISAKITGAKDQPAKSIKHADHDQSEHGNWATGNFAQGTSKGGNGLRVLEAVRMQLRTDSYKPGVYAAQEKLAPPRPKDNVAPTGPKRSDFETREEYEKAYKAYSKAFDEYGQRALEHIVSDTGKQLLDGSMAGARKYVEAVVGSDWFQESFGNGQSIGGIPPMSAGDSTRVMGSFSMTADGAGTIEKTSLRFAKVALKMEPTLLHEIAHFATAISATEKYEPHGVEFAKNYVYIADKVAGSKFSTALQDALVEKGVPIGN